MHTLGVESSHSSLGAHPLGFGAGGRDGHTWSGVSHSSQGAQPPGFGAGIVRGWTYLEWSLTKVSHCW